MSRLPLIVLAIFVTYVPTRAAEADLDLIPPDCAGFLRIRPVELWKSPAFDDQRDVLKLAAKEFAHVFEQKLGVSAGDVERLTFIFPDLNSFNQPFPDGNPMLTSSLMVVALGKPYDRDKLIKGLLTDAIPHGHDGKKYYLDPENWSCLHPVDEKVFVYGSEEALIWLFHQQAKKKETGPLSAALQLAAGKSQIVAAVNGAVFPAEIVRVIPEDLAPLFAARSAMLRLDVEKQLVIELRGDFKNADDAKAGEKALGAAAKMLLAHLNQLISRVEKHIKDENVSWAESVGHAYLLAWLRRANVELSKMRIERAENEISTTFRFDVVPHLPAMTVMFGSVLSIGRSAAEAFEHVGDAIGGDRDPLTKIHDALEAYHKDKGHYPPPAITTRDGKPLLSWRVALLPYMGEKALYEQFKLDEPWYSRHNKKLIVKIPQAFRSDSWNARHGKTNYQLFVGEGSLFESGKSFKKDDIKDKPEHTLLVAKTPYDHTARWSRPVDIAFNPKQPLKWYHDKEEREDPIFGGKRFQREPEMTLLMADGSKRRLEKIDASVLKAIITRNGGETVDLPEK